MGKVHLAQGTKLDGKVALKNLPTDVDAVMTGRLIKRGGQSEH